MDSSDSNSSFGFAFNNVRFSDRLLRIEITNGGEITNVSSVQDRKRRRTDVNTRGGENEKECNPNQAPRVRELHISSPILAAKSPFFFKLFSNGMIESEQKHITMRIEADEEAAVMELLNFMYTNSLSSVTVPALFRVLMAADKFEVASCMKYCTRLLLNVPMTLPYALFILRHPCPLLLADSVKPLTNAARHFLALHYKDVTKFPTEELKALPLVGVTTLLMSNDLMIASEDTVYEVVLEWAKANYSVLEERQVILSRLARYIRFPYMTCPRLKKILTSDDFEPSVAYKLVLEALFFKAEPSLDQGLIQRAYTCRPIKTVEFEVPHRQSIVYLDLTRQECNALYPSNRIYSQEFQLGGQEFFLSACCNKNQLNGFHCFGLFLRAQLKGSVSMTVAYNFSARRKPTHEFVLRSRGKYKFTRGVESIGFKDLFGTSWASFTREDCFYFINDVLHLRAEISISP